MKPVNLKFKGLGSYFGECEIDFSSLDSIFLICGETGSGKTTILDAIMFALYGESSGGERHDLMNSHYTKSDGEAYSVFVFELSGRLYRFSRTFTPKARAAGWDISRNCEHFDGASQCWLPFFDNPREKEVNAKAEELLGLTPDQFRQVVILPQGKFERLLTCPTKEKEALLSTLFGAERYTEISERLKKNADNEKKSIDAVQLSITAALNAAGFESPDHAESCAQELSQAAAENKEKLKAALSQKKQLEKASAEAAVLADKFSALNEAEKKLATLSQRRADFDRQKQRIDRLLREKNVLSETESYTAALNEHERRKKEVLNAQTALNKAAEQKESEAKRENAHKSRGPENEERKASLIRLRGLEEVYKTAEPMRIEAENALETGKKLRREYDNTGARINELKKQISEKSALCEAAEAEAAKAFGLLEKLRALEDTAKIYEEAEKTKELSTKLSRELEETDIQIKQAEEKASLAKAGYESARRAFIDGISCRLAEELSEGAPCPVCGSTHHPKKNLSEVKFSEKEMDAAAKSLKDAESEISRLSERRKGTEQKISEAAEKISELSAKCPEGFDPNILSTVKAEYKKSLAEQERLPVIRDGIKELNTALSDLEIRYNSLSAELQAAREDYKVKDTSYKNARERMDKDIPDTAALEVRIKELSRLTEEYDKVSAQISENILKYSSAFAAANIAMQNAYDEESRASEKCAAAKEKAEKLLAENHLPPVDEFVPDKQGIESLPVLQKSCEEFFTELLRCEEGCKQLRSELSDKQPPDMKGMSEQLEAAEQACRSLDFEIRSAEEKITSMHELAENCRKQLSELDKRRETYAAQNEFASLMSGEKGISFTRYVLGVMLDMVTEEANRMLSGMLGGAFRLVRSRDVGRGSKQGLDLMVENTLADNSASYMAAQLSGGEKFLISLVLGVALSTVVQSRFGGITIDAMFIDEGFGSLDPTSLADAVSVICGISGSRRTVGIISHVEKLREEIPCCISVTKTRTGSRISY